MSDSLIQAFKSTTNGAADGTGVLKLVAAAQKLLGTIPENLIAYTLGIQHAIFGDYPTTKDIAPSSIFLAIFIIFMLAHLYIFTKNYSRGHKFWLSLLFAFYCLMRWIGFCLRIVWAKDILKMKVGLASSVFIIVPSVWLASLNLVLAQRIFTLHHPHLGSSNLFWAMMIIVYAVVTGVVVMAIVGAVIPYIYYLSQHHYDMCKQVVQAAAVLAVLYSCLALTLALSAFVIKPTKRAKEIVTYQPWWIECFSPFYYVPKNACRDAEASFKTRDPTLAKRAVRVIASTVHQHRYETIERVQSVTSKSGELGHTMSLTIIILTSAILLLSSIFRCVSTFIDEEKSEQSWIYEPVVMYVMFGVLETIVNVFYLVGRVDLRFYRPDKLGKIDFETDETLNGSDSNNNQKPLDEHFRSPSDVSVSV